MFDKLLNFRKKKTTCPSGERAKHLMSAFGTSSNVMHANGLVQIMERSVAEMVRMQYISFMTTSP